MYFRYQPKQTKSERIIYVQEPSRGKKHFWGEYGKNYGFYTSEDQQRFKSNLSMVSIVTPSSKNIYKPFHRRSNTQTSQRYDNRQPQHSPYRSNKLSKNFDLVIKNNSTNNYPANTKTPNKQTINKKLQFQKNFNIKVQFPKIKNKNQIKSFFKNLQEPKQGGKYIKKSNWNLHKEIKKNRKLSPTYQSSRDNTLVPVNYPIQHIDN